MATIDRVEHGRATLRRAQRRSRWSPRLRILIGLGIVLVACWLGYAALQLVRAREEALTGIEDLEALRSSMTVESVNSGSALEGLDRANEHFRAANDRAGSLALAPLRMLPIVGRQVRSVDALTDAASDVTTIAEARLDEAGALLESGHVTAPERVDYVEDIAQLAGDAGAELGGVDLGPADGLVGPLARARDRFDDELESLQRSAENVESAAGSVATLLQGPRTTLLLASNNSEMRVGSGAFLSAGVLTTSDGSMRLSPMRTITEFNLPDDRVPARGELATLWGWLEPNREWRNLASSPRFDANAELATQMWKASTGRDVDGVLAIDIVALRGLLAATGPVEVDGLTIGADNVLEDVMLTQYNRAAPRNNEDERREHLSLVASAVVRRLEEGAWSPEELASQLIDVAAGRHLLLWSADTDDQAGWEAVDVAGTLGPNSLLLGIHNRGGNKLDQFLDVDATGTARAVADGTRVDIDLQMRNTAPAGLPPKVDGPFKNAVGGAAGRYQGLVVFQLPGAAQDIRFDGVERLAASGPDGENQVIATYVELDRGALATYTLTFVVPESMDTLRIEPSARVPTVHWSFPGDEWTDSRPRSLPN